MTLRGSDQYLSYLRDLREESLDRLRRLQEDESLGEYRQSLESDERRRLRDRESDLSLYGLR
jgi:hypothetical protein